MTIDAENETLMLLLSFGESMLQNGAEVSRIEDTLIRMGQAYGASKMHVFVITSSIIVTMEFPDGRIITQSRRILNTAGIDFRKLEELNSLSRRCCETGLSVQELKNELLQQTPRSYRWIETKLGSVLAAFGFSIFFGGTWLEGIISALFALFICGQQKYLDPICTNKVAFCFLSSFLTGTGIQIAALFCPAIRIDKVMLGDIMLLIPGIAMTNSVRDILIGDTISGFMRLLETLLWALSLAVGFMAAIWLFGRGR